MTAISAGRFTAFHGETGASSTIFDSSQSATPVIAFYRRRVKYISPVMGGY